MPLGIMVTTIAFVVRVAGTSGKTNAILFVWHYAGEEHPFPATTKSKFNPLQQVAYVGVMYGLLPLLLLTGLLCLYPQAVGDVFPGVRYWLLQAHFALAFISLFLSSVIFIFAPRGVRHTKPLKAWSMAITGTNE